VVWLFLEQIWSEFVPVSSDNRPTLPSALDKKIVLQSQLYDLFMQGLQVDCTFRLGFCRNEKKHLLRLQVIDRTIA
jgi:hypothetical protein